MGFSSADAPEQQIAHIMYSGSICTLHSGVSVNSPYLLICAWSCRRALTPLATIPPGLLTQVEESSDNPDGAFWNRLLSFRFAVGVLAGLPLKECPLGFPSGLATWIEPLSKERSASREAGQFSWDDSLLSSPFCTSGTVSDSISLGWAHNIAEDGIFKSPDLLAFFPEAMLSSMPEVAIDVFPQTEARFIDFFRRRFSSIRGLSSAFLCKEIRGVSDVSFFCKQN
mmetsp:Transcript_15411/g.37955  ORF Transcript_15411/g.37955 Transcript_15411/m.37955 type:complete len:226 (+) Transcript_15411:2917-3594(+)